MFALSKESIDQVWYGLWFGAKERMKLYKSLATLLRNNVPLRRALVTSYEVYSDYGKKPDRIEAIVLQDCIAGIDNGRALSSVLQQWVPFDEHSTIATGDRGGKVADALMRGAEVIKRKGMMRKALVGALTYPAFLMLSVGIAFYIMATTVMPRVLANVKPEHMDPSIHLLSSLSSFVANNGVLMLVFIVVAAFGIGMSMPRLKGKVRFYLEKVPPWSMYRIVQGAIFIYNVGVLLEANVPKKDILEMMLERANPYIAERLDGALLGVKNGLDLGDALRESGFDFPSRDAIAYISVIGSMEGGEAQLKEFGEDWLDESVERLAVASAIFKQIAILLGGLLIMAIVQGVNALSNGMLN